MERIEKTVFLSYRRANVPWAVAIYQDLTHHGYDVFLDFSGIPSGDFEQAILGNIHARAHFLVVLTPSALDRCGDSGDWLRREIETAIGARRNVVPLMFEGFDFDAPEVASRLTGPLAALRRYNALPVYAEYFGEAMGQLRGRFLNVPLDAVLHPVSLVAQQAAKEQQAAASSAPALQEKELAVQELLQRLNEASIKAASWHRNPAEAGEAGGVARVADTYLTGRRGFQSFMCNLGLMYQKGQAGLPKDEAQAASWYRRAAEAGDGFSMDYLGTIYRDGLLGLPKDDVQAVGWFRKAADGGEANGMNNLGFMYQGGRGGLPKDDAQAVKWFCKAAGAGNAYAMFNLALMYQSGQGGLRKDESQAVDWYRKAAEAGDTSAMCNLAWMYENGRGGLRKDDGEAMEWYRKAAALGNTAAQDALQRLQGTSIEPQK